MLDKLYHAIVEMREPEALQLAEEALKSGISPLMLMDCCRQAVVEVGQRYQSGRYYLAELMLAGQMLTQISALFADSSWARAGLMLTEQMLKEISGSREESAAATEGEGGQRPKLGRVLMGTVKGDIHDIGKNIVTFMLDINGFEVRDLGVDVDPQVFVKEAMSFQPHIVGMSGLLTLACESMEETVRALETAGLRENIKIMIGGAPINEQVREYTRADAWGKDAVAAVALAKKWMGVA
ncbi:MAG: methionine synthase [Firmicutes bacterium]|jgi:5-methyltetrahydrofolate--homocysteine methyltransferase|nr:methionine synthase [Bacillota bacterium]HPU01117.1 cobalamin-dependent protein [Bacillota bacterium]